MCDIHLENPGVGDCVTYIWKNPSIEVLYEDTFRGKRLSDILLEVLIMFDIHLDNPSVGEHVAHI